MRLLRMAGLLLAALAGVAGGAFLLVDRVIFQPSSGVDLRPERMGLRAEEVSLRTEDGVELHAFYLPAPGATRALLFLHGNAGNASQRLPHAAALMRLGSHVLLPDYRGYGLSQGSPSEPGLYADARAALSHLTEGRALPEGRIVVFARSLGSAVAVDLARDRALAGVILEGAFPSLSAVARDVLGPPGAWLVRGRFESDRKIVDVRSPVLALHAARDDVIDIELGRRLFALAPRPAAFEVIRGAGHDDTMFVGGRSYYRIIGRFLDEVAPP